MKLANAAHWISVALVAVSSCLVITPAAYRSDWGAVTPWFLVAAWCGISVAYRGMWREAKTRLDHLEQLERER